VEPARLPEAILRRAAAQAPLAAEEADDRTLVILARPRETEGGGDAAEAGA
jgi:hypothetical protein